MNAVIYAVSVMLVLSLLRVNVVLALVAGAIVGGLTGGLSLNETIISFTEGLGEGATIAISYALLGGFAVGDFLEDRYSAILVRMLVCEERGRE